MDVAAGEWTRLVAFKTSVVALARYQPRETGTVGIVAGSTILCFHRRVGVGLCQGCGHIFVAFEAQAIAGCLEYKLADDAVASVTGQAFFVLERFMGMAISGRILKLFVAFKAGPWLERPGQRSTLAGKGDQKGDTEDSDVADTGNGSVIGHDFVGRTGHF